jgi:hypothetical protein
MGEYELHSLILACDFRVDDVEGMWKPLENRRPESTSISAHQVVLYTSISEPRPCLDDNRNSQLRSIRDVMRSPAIFEWFDISAVDDINRYSTARSSRRLTCTGSTMNRSAQYRAEWMSNAGLDAYPTQFIGRYAHLTSIEEQS